MKVYSIKKITGYYLGIFPSPYWSYTEPLGTCLSLVIPEERFAEVAWGYERYLYYVGQNTFGYKYIPSGTAKGPNPLCEFVAYYFYKIFPWYRKQFVPVGAGPHTFEGLGTMKPYKGRKPTAAVRPTSWCNLFLRYNERIWCARAVEITETGWLGYVQGPWIETFLMFEKRGTTKALKNEDTWSFGMAWFEGFPAYGGVEEYLWEWAEVTYLGMGVRLSGNTGKVQIFKP